MKPETISIKTLPIEIHVIKVGNRQMTKAVFYQIPIISENEVLQNARQKIIDKKMEFLGWINVDKGSKLIDHPFKPDELMRVLTVWALIIYYGELKRVHIQQKYVDNKPQLFIAI